jgi:hypothetical protein
LSCDDFADGVVPQQIGRGDVAAAGTRERRLQGALCEDSREARQAASACADFLVMRKALSKQELAALCTGIDLPVFARGVALERAWELGASGVNSMA